MQSAFDTPSSHSSEGRAQSDVLPLVARRGLARPGAGRTGAKNRSSPMSESVRPQEPPEGFTNDTRLSGKKGSLLEILREFRRLPKCDQRLPKAIAYNAPEGAGLFTHAELSGIQEMRICAYMNYMIFRHDFSAVGAANPIIVQIRGRRSEIWVWFSH